MPDGSAGASLQQADPEPTGGDYETQPDWSQPDQEQEALPHAWEGLQQAPPHYDSAAPGGSDWAASQAAQSDVGSQALPRLVVSHSAGVLQAVAEEEVRTVVPGRAQLTPVEAALLPALIRLSGGVIDALLRRLHEALGPGLLRWGCRKDFEEDFLEDSSAVPALPSACMPTFLSPGLCL